MSDRAGTLLASFNLTDQLMPIVLGDLTEEDAKQRTRGDEGPSIAWTLGHMLHYRLTILGLLGVERTESLGERFGNAAATAGEEYPTLAEWQELWSSVHADLAAALGAATDEQLDGRSAWSSDHGEDSVMDKLSFLVWHEAYHMGVIGAARKAMGYLGTAEKVMAARDEAGGG